MTQNKFTTNNNPTLVAVSNSDGETPVYLYADPSTHGLVVGASFTPPTSATATETSVASSATSVSLLALNSGRKQATFYNDSTQILYLKLGATASSTSFTVAMVAASYYELPSPVYTGAIDGIWASANGNVRITELT